MQDQHSQKCLIPSRGAIIFEYFMCPAYKYMCPAYKYMCRAHSHLSQTGCAERGLFFISSAPLACGSLRSAVPRCARRPSFSGLCAWGAQPLPAGQLYCNVKIRYHAHTQPAIEK